MNPLLFKILLFLATEGIKLGIKHYASLTPEQKAAWQEAIKSCEDPMAGPPPGSGP